jgi:putative peptidoglycan lipid II flippase
MILRLPHIFKKNTEWFEKQQSTILSAAAVITVSNVMSLVFGLLREYLLIYKYFDTPAQQQAYEAFQIAFQIPDTMFQLIILGAVSAAFIPVFTHLKKKDSEEVAFRMSSTAMTLLLLVFIVASLVVAYFAYPITAGRTGDTFTADQIIIAAKLTQIMLVAQLFFAVSNFLTGILQSYQRFIIPAIAPVLYNVGIIAGVFLFADQFGIYAAGIGVIMGAFIHMAIQIPLVRKIGFRYRPQFNFSFPGVKQFFVLLPPRLLTIGISELQNLALGFFATSVGNIGFTIIRLALRLMTIPIRLFGVPISQASLPFLSQESADDQTKNFGTLLSRSLNHIAFFAYPCAVLLLILRVPIVRLIYGAPNFPWTATLLVAKCLALMAVSIAVQAMVQLLVRAFYAMHDTTTPFWVTVIHTAVYLLLNWYFVFYTDLGVLGIAIGTTASAFAEFFLYMILLNRKIPSLASRALFVPQLKIIVTSFLMAVFLYLPFRIFDELIFNTTRTVELIGLTITTGTIGGLVYLYFSALFDVHELQSVIQLLIPGEKRWKKQLAQTQEILVETSVEGDEV